MAHFILLILQSFPAALALPYLAASPISTSGSALSVSIASELQNISGTRTLSDIIWGSFVTIFACTWVAVHPNIPPQRDGDWAVLRHRLKIMAYMLLVPELVLYWASKQWYAAARAERRHRDKGWTRAHGFFIGMGGLVLADADADGDADATARKSDPAAGRPLDLETLEDLVELGVVDWPRICADDVRDKSKGDYLTKGLAVAQIAWFVVQCLARAALGFALPELELATLGFAVLSGAMYFFWWDKPLDVRRPLVLFAKAPRGVVFAGQTETASVDYDERDSNGPSLYNTHTRPHLRRAQSLPSVSLSPNSAAYSSPSQESYESDSRSSSVRHAPLYSTSPTPSSRTPTQPPAERRPPLAHCEVPKTPKVQRTYRSMLLYPIQALIDDAQEMKDSGHISASGVSQFYAGARLGIDHQLSVLLFAIGTAFGGIHCVAWSFAFPSAAQKWLWRSASLGVVALPSLIAGNFLTVHYFTDVYAPGQRFGFAFSRARMRVMVGNFLINSSGTRMAVCFGLYVASRLLLLVLPLVELRSLPTSAYQSISWTGLIPHVL